jgi:hypothetical protein
VRLLARNSALSLNGLFDGVAPKAFDNTTFNDPHLAGARDSSWSYLRASPHVSIYATAEIYALTYRYLFGTRSYLRQYPRASTHLGLIVTTEEQTTGNTYLAGTRDSLR